jgi:hypothetical protein
MKLNRKSQEYLNQSQGLIRNKTEQIASKFTDHEIFTISSPFLSFSSVYRELHYSDKITV